MHRIATRPYSALLPIILAAALIMISATVHAGDMPADHHAPDVVRDDLDELYAQLQAAHYDLYTRRDKKEYDRLYLAMRRASDAPASHLEVQKAFQRFVAFGNVAHAQIPLPFAEFRQFVDAGGRILPFGIRVANGGVYITQEASGIASLQAGMELVTVDGQPAMQWLDQLARYISADHAALAHGLLEFWLQTVAWMEFGEPENIAIEVRDNNKLRALTVPLRTTEAIRETRKQQASPGLDTDFSTREVHLLDDGIAYLRPGPFYNTEGEKTWDDTAFRHFIDDAFEHILEADAKDLIIDLRNNPGGDKSFSDLLVAWIADRDFQFYSTFEFKVSEPTRKSILERADTYRDLPDNPFRLMQEMAKLVRTHDNGDIVTLDIGNASPRPGPRFEGRVYALINRHSYSNATAVAALLQDYGFATILGETTHDLPSSYGAAESFTLSRTGIQVHYPKSWFVRPSGDANLQGVVPDVPIPTPVIESADDRVLESAVEYIRQKR